MAESTKMEAYCITAAPPAMYYIPNFITQEEEQTILQKIPSNRWVELSHRRLQAVPAQLTATNTLLSASSLPTWLTDPILDRFAQLGLFADAPHGAVNHCLINEYLPGQGIMPHEDGSAYHPVVATVSLGGTVVLNVTEKPSADGASTTAATSDAHIASPAAPRKRWRILQEPSSLLVTTGLAYTETLHGIAEVTEDVDLGPETIANWALLGNSETYAKGTSTRTTRISLTFRDVKKVSTLGNKIFGKTR